uniref:Histidine decarboxylase n=1 Tax=Candidatus Kentrum sp. FW TaxID=2126338 RepID=A0A450U482_9GAMM|nr:MAG: hypothetical protein BECKFW1821C_GA0114237_11675 [Candidatus Kentron sp. FW]
MQPDLSARDQRQLDNLFDLLERKSRFQLGYPLTKNFDYSSLFRFLRHSINNMGDPFLPGSYRLGTRGFEVEVLEWFAKLLGFPRDETWGYVTGGGTEGNLHGLYEVGWAKAPCGALENTALSLPAPCPSHLWLAAGSPIHPGARETMMGTAPQGPRKDSSVSVKAPLPIPRGPFSISVPSVDKNLLTDWNS